MLGTDVTLVMKENLVIRRVDRKVLDRDTGFIFELNEEAFFIFQQFEKPATIKKVCDDVHAHFYVSKEKEADTCAKVRSFCQKAQDEKILVVA